MTDPIPPVITYEFGVEWALGSGTWPCQGPNCPPAPEPGEADHVHLELSDGVTSLQQAPGDPRQTTYNWPDTVCGFADGPRPLVDCEIMAKPYVDECTTSTDQESGEETKVCVRTYPAYRLAEEGVTLGTSLPASTRTFPESPYIRPTQFGGCVLYRERLGGEKAGGEWVYAGICDTQDREVTLAGYIPTGEEVDTIGQFNSNYGISLASGNAFTWQPPGDWYRMLGGAMLTPDIEVETVADLPCDVALNTTAWVRFPPPGTALPDGIGGAVYYAAPNSNDEANLDPFPEWFCITDPQPASPSGYSYLDVFDEAEMEYVERCSEQMAVDYVGSIPISKEGYFPTQPLNPSADPPLYPMDSVTKFIPDQRDSVTVIYTCGATFEFDAIGVTHTVSETIDVFHKVLAPQEDWADVLKGLLNTCYFTHGYYESYKFLTEPRADSNYIPMDDIPIRDCESRYY